MPIALITGVTGQDGYYLAELLDIKGYEVFGLVHGQNNPRTEQLREELPFIRAIEGDLLDSHSLTSALDLSQPDEVYNLAGISFVPMSFNQPEHTLNVTGLGVLRILEAIRRVNSSIKLYQASSSEMFGNVEESPQRESTPLNPRSPYAAAKALGHHLAVSYRESYDLFVVSGILFNHESPRRPMEFVTRKVTNGAARIKVGIQNELLLGSLEARRDWGYAGDYVRAMWQMLQQPEPEDYVVGTGVTHSVDELVRIAFSVVGIEEPERFVKVDERFFRPKDVDRLVADPTKARTRLGWQPSVGFEELIRMMVEHDLRYEAQKRWPMEQP